MSDLSHLPAFWPAADLAWLDGSFFAVQLSMAKKAVEEDYLTVCHCGQ